MSTKQAAKTHIAGLASRKKTLVNRGEKKKKGGFHRTLRKHLLGVSELKLFAIKNCLFIFFEGCMLEWLG